MMKQTTIAVSEETKGILDNLKIHSRQSYDEVIQIIILKNKLK